MPATDNFTTRVLLLWDPAVDTHGKALESFVKTLRWNSHVLGIAIASGTDFDGALDMRRRYSSLSNLYIAFEDFDYVRRRWLPLGSHDQQLPRAFIIKPRDGVTWTGPPNEIGNALKR